MKQSTKLIRVTARGTNLNSSARDFQRRQFKKSPNRNEREGYAEVIEMTKLNYSSQFSMAELRKP